MISLPLDKLERESVQVLPDAEKNSTPGFFIVSPRGSILPHRATRQREVALRDWYRADEQTMIRGAFSGVAKKIAALPYEIAGEDTGTYNRDYFQNVFNEADFGRGMARLVVKLVLDYLRQDVGAFIELVAPGNPTKAPTGPVTGIAYLDSLRCIPTGDPEFPAVYCDRQGKYHRLHHTRVIQILDMEDGDESQPGYGDCALSRAITIASRQLHMNRYIEQFLDDKPAPGITVVQNVMKDQLMAVLSYAQRQRDNYELPVYGDRAFLFGMSPEFPVGMEHLNFSTAPEKFDWKVYTDIDINMLALAMNVDVQELWQLVGQSMGSGQQSEILHQKSRGKTIGFLITALTRAFNSILPDGFQFAFKYLDEEEAAQEATKAQTWAGTINNLRPYLPDVVLTQLAINQIEAVADAFTDVDEGRGRSDDVDSDPVQADDSTVDGTPEQADDAPDTGDEADIEEKAISTDVPDSYAVLGYFDDISRIQHFQDALRIALGGNAEYNDPATFHVTLLYSQDAQFADIQDSLPINPAAFSVTVDGMGVFDTPDGYAVHLTIRNEGTITSAQAALSMTAQDNGVEISPYSRVDAYNPHITLAYTETPVEPVNITPFTLLVNRIEVSSSDHQPLTIQNLKSTTDTGGKSIQATRLDFESRFAAIQDSLRLKEIDRRRAGLLLRGSLRTFGARAYRDGLSDGGVTDATMSDDDMTRFNLLLAQQSQYVSNFTATVIGAGISDAQAFGKPQMWFNKSIQPFYDAGLLSANKNGNYEWVLGATEQHCKDCSRLNGQIHRLKSYFAKNLYPKSSALACRGFRCDCRLIRTAERARGRF